MITTHEPKLTVIRPGRLLQIAKARSIYICTTTPYGTIGRAAYSEPHSKRKKIREVSEVGLLARIDLLLTRNDDLTLSVKLGTISTVFREPSIILLYCGCF